MKKIFQIKINIERKLKNLDKIMDELKKKDYN